MGFKPSNKHQSDTGCSCCIVSYVIAKVDRTMVVWRVWRSHHHHQANHLGNDIGDNAAEAAGVRLALVAWLEAQQDVQDDNSYRLQAPVRTNYAVRTQPRTPPASPHPHTHLHPTPTIGLKPRLRLAPQGMLHRKARQYRKRGTAGGVEI